MTTDRQRTALAATAATGLLAKLNNHLLDVDHLNEAERYMLSTSPVADVTSGDGPAGLAFAAYLLYWAGDVIAEVTRTTPPATRDQVAERQRGS